MNKQEIFDKVIARLFDGKGISYDDGCKYRNKDGNKCAVGCLIPDELYDPAMDDVNLLAEKFPAEKKFLNTSFSYIGRAFPEMYNYLGGDDNNRILTRLQHIHDNSGEWEGNMPSLKMIDRLYSIAKDFNLDLPEYVKIYEKENFGE